MMKQIATTMIIGTLVTSGILGGLFGNAKKITPIGHINYIENMTQKPNIEDYLPDFNFLTEEEKTQLIEDEKQVNSIYEKIDELKAEVDKISENIFNKYDEIFKKYDELIKANPELWKKLYDEESHYEESQNENTHKDVDVITSNADRINISKVLTAEEKQKMLAVEKELDKLEVEIDKVYDEIEKATAELNEKIDTLYEQADFIYEKSADIWNKIYENEFDLPGFTDPIPYSK